MKNLLLALALLAFVSQVRCQNSDTNSLRTPFIKAKNLMRNERPIRITQAKIDVKVIGSLAVTTVEIAFFNPNNRILEAELHFPLAEGQSISRFALDIGGKLREGVAVEKAKGQATFEAIVRRQVDPGLLEKTTGNNFCARVYPLSRNETRRVVIAYEQELDKKGSAYRFHLPVAYRDNLDTFNINVSVSGSSSAPQVEEAPWSSFDFDRKGEAYIAGFSARDYEAQGQIVFSVPIKKEENTFVEKGKISGQHTFYTKIFPEISASDKELPKVIDLYWDTSGSMESRNFELESQFLESYFSFIGNLTVNLYTFNLFAGKPQTFIIEEGNWAELRATLQHASYDGATQFGSLDFTRSEADKILIFSDGSTNFGLSAIKAGNAPVAFVTSLKHSDHSNLQHQALSTGGKYINLMKQTPDEATRLLMHESFRLTSAEYNREEIADFTASTATIQPGSGFSVAGKLLVPQATVILKFGVGNKVLHTESIELSTTNAGNYDNIVERVWAAKKIAELDLMSDRNKAGIEALGKQYRIVTGNTSLIVLEAIEDYIGYEVIPPDELLKQYKKAMRKEKSAKIYDITLLLKERMKWWNETSNAKTVQIPDLYENSASSGQQSRQTKEFVPVLPNIETVSGTITNTDGELLSDVSIYIKGKYKGTITDDNGRYSIRAADGDVLVYNYIGYDTEERAVLGSVINVALRYMVHYLEETAVTSNSGNDRRRIRNEDRTRKSPSRQASFAPASPNPLHVADGVTGNVPESSTLKAWRADAPYMDKLEKCPDRELYATYLALRKEYKDTPSFFLDAATIFAERKMKQEALLILSNVVEMNRQDYRLMRVIAHRLMQLGYTDYAIDRFEEVFTLRPNELQSYRDLALAHEQNRNYQKAIDLLHEALLKKWNHCFPTLKIILLDEMNHAIATAKREGIKLHLKGIDKRLICHRPVDIRIVLNWDTDRSDMDLWVTDPKNEKCGYRHTRTKNGGMISDDCINGYGPEVFLIKKALKGKYKIEVDYFGAMGQIPISTTTIYLDIFTHYGKPKEEKRTVMLRLSKIEAVVEAGEIEW